jgi:hypothetical protein
MGYSSSRQPNALSSSVTQAMVNLNGVRSSSEQQADSSSEIATDGTLFSTTVFGVSNETIAISIAYARLERRIQACTVQVSVRVERKTQKPPSSKGSAKSGTVLPAKPSRHNAAE